MEPYDTKAVDDKPVFNPSLTAAQWSQTKQTRSTVDTIEDNIAATIEANPMQVKKKKDTLQLDAQCQRDAAKSALNFEAVESMQQDKGESKLQLSESEEKEHESSKYKEEIVATGKKLIEHPLEDDQILSERLDADRSGRLAVDDIFN